MIDPWHFSLAVPAANVDLINAAGAQMQYGPTNFSVPLVTPPNMAAVTHYGCAFCGSEGFRTMMDAAKIGTLPYFPDGSTWADRGFDEDELRAAFMSVLFTDVQNVRGQARANFAAMLSDNGLALMPVGEP